MHLAWPAPPSQADVADRRMQHPAGPEKRAEQTGRRRNGAIRPRLRARLLLAPSQSPAQRTVMSCLRTAEP